MHEFSFYIEIKEGTGFYKAIEEAETTDFTITIKARCRVDAVKQFKVLTGNNPDIKQWDCVAIN